MSTICQLYFDSTFLLAELQSQKYIHTNSPKVLSKIGPFCIERYMPGGHKPGDGKLFNVSIRQCDFQSAYPFDIETLIQVNKQAKPNSISQLPNQINERTAKYMAKSTQTMRSRCIVYQIDH